MLKPQNRDELRRLAIKDNRVFLYNGIKAVDMGATTDDLLNLINNMEDALKTTQAECIRLYNERSLEAFRTEVLYTSHIQREGFAEND